MLTGKKEKDFIKLPDYPGGPKALKDFIKLQLKYPQKALTAGIEGHVLLSYKINEDGVVHGQHVIKSLGHDCDEEAIRVVGLLKFKKVKNRNLRVNAIKKIFIHFKLPKLSINYTISQSASQNPEKSPDKESGYTIIINP